MTAEEIESLRRFIEDEEMTGSHRRAGRLYGDRSIAWEAGFRAALGVLRWHLGYHMGIHEIDPEPAWSTDSRDGRNC